MINIEEWLANYMKVLRATFSERLWFVGLQGSYGRGEATSSSDIDVVVILDQLSIMDVKIYNDMLDTLPHRELICGFLSGKNELVNWEPSDLFQLYYDTTPIEGSLDDLLCLLDANAVTKAIKSGVCNIYHGCVHNMLYEKSEEILKGLYKAASFVVQAIGFQETGKYIRSHAELRNSVSESEREILEISQQLKKDKQMDFSHLSEVLFHWCKQRITR